MGHRALKRSGRDATAAADPMASCHQIAAQILTRPDEVAQRLELERRDEYRPQLPRRMQPGQLQRVARVGLDLWPG